MDRAHNYAAAGAGLLAAVIGLVMAIVAVVRVIASAGIGFAGERSTLASAVALLLVGVPVWWHYWSKVRTDRAVEVETMVRYVTLVGSGGRDLADVVTRRTGVKLWLFERPGLDVGFSADEVVAAIESAEHEQLLIVARRRRPEVIPGRQGRPRLRRGRGLACTHGGDPGGVGRSGPGPCGRRADRSGAVALRAPGLDVGFSADEVVAAIESAEREQLLIVARRGGPDVIPLPARSAGHFLLTFLDPRWS